MRLDAGTRIAQYRLERRLGTGGMGDVFLARDTRLDRLVAIKFLTTPADEQARRRLLREARVIASLDHPGICTVHEVGSDPDGGDFIAMQYVEGETLAAQLRRGRMQPDEALGITAHVAEALQVAHHHGLVHRDLKPQNIIITPSGLPKLLDFGLATQAPLTAEAANAATSSQISNPDSVIGTPGYMSPEQVRNDTVDFRTDVFALGCVLYECLTGRRAFMGATIAETLAEILHVEPPPPSTLVPELGTGYDVLCERLLSKDRSERFQSAEEVLGAIRSHTRSTGAYRSPPTVKTRVRRGPSRRVVIGTALVAAAAVGGLLWSQRTRSLPRPTSEAAVWYERGVEAMRDGSYAGARDAFREAVRLFPQYAQAFSRLAEAHTALDDERSAQSALLEVTRLLPDRSKLAPDDQLRFEAATESALRHHSQAITAYRRIADAKPGEAGRWLDVGRAEEMASQGVAARATYAKAVQLDPQYAAGHLRLGVLLARNLDSNGLTAIDEAIRLYRLASNSEGEAEALLRKGAALSVLRKFPAARQALEGVLKFADDPRYASQRVRAKLELARVAFFDGRLDDAQTLATQGITEATASGLQTLAATGSISLGNSFLGSRRYDAADAQYIRAIDLATGRQATRTEMRARLQRASLKLQTNLPQEALTLAEAPLKYFRDAGESRVAIEAQLVISRAHEDLEHYEQATQAATEVFELAEANKDEALIASSLENLAGLSSTLGRLPEALAHRERIEAIHRRQNDQNALPVDLTNRANLLVQLGRGIDAEKVLTEIDKAIAAGSGPYLSRRSRVGLLRALRACVDRRFADVERQAAIAMDPALSATPYAIQFGRVLAEYARAELGRSRVPPSTLTGWPAEATSAADRRDVSYWVAMTLHSKRAYSEAYAVAAGVLADPAVAANPELGWRLAAVAASAAKAVPSLDPGASMAAQSRKLAELLTNAWPAAASAYFARPDLAILRARVR